MSKICNSPYFFDRLSFSKKEILKKVENIFNGIRTNSEGG